MQRRTPRRRAFHDPGHAHELTFSCYRGLALLASDLTRGWLAESIEEARSQQDLDLWAFVFMPEHVHLIVRPRRAVYAIATILRSIKGPVGRRAIAYLEAHHPAWLPRLTRERGGRTERVFWQPGGGYDRNVDEPGTLMAMIEYIHQNPVRRGLVGRPADWRWSSAGWYGGQDVCPLRPDRLPPEWVP